MVKVLLRLKGLDERQHSILLEAITSNEKRAQFVHWKSAASFNDGIQVDLVLKTHTGEDADKQPVSFDRLAPLFNILGIFPRAKTDVSIEEICKSIDRIRIVASSYVPNKVMSANEVIRAQKLMIISTKCEELLARILQG